VPKFPVNARDFDRGAFRRNPDWLESRFPTLLGVTIVAFSFIRLIPSDPIEVMVGELVCAAGIARARAEIGMMNRVYNMRRMVRPMEHGAVMTP
jgi:ABC-type microcin C transport system permease subunit YejB